MKTYDLHNYEIVRTQFFASASMTSVSISPNGIRFSMACIRKFPETEYIELKVHPHNHMLAVVPCSDRNKQKMCWARLRDDSISVRLINGSAFLGTLYELFDWDFERRYRLRGEIVRHGEEIMALFNVLTPEIFSSRYDFEMPWTTSFGENFHMHKKSRPGGALMMGVFSEYDSEPNLRPTSQKMANKNIRTLIDKMHNVSDSNASTNILS